MRHVIHVSTGKGKIPEDEMEIATDLYAAMQSFFKKFDEYRPRPLFIMGESYAGKYVPSIGGSPFSHLGETQRGIHLSVSAA
jgi:carboxypeptidase C (cathepsin A)